MNVGAKAALRRASQPDFGVDAPAVMRNFFLVGALCLALIFVTPATLHFGPVIVLWHSSLGWMGGCLLLQGCLFLLYVKVGKFRHRDFMLGLHSWQGEERVLDVGCGRGLLLAGAAKRLTVGHGQGRGHATGIDIWSNTDMGGNSEAATQRNLELEQIVERCSLISAGAQQMPFTDAAFDLVVSNLCLHNIYDRPTRQQAVAEIARVLRPGGTALLSDYKLTGEYATQLRELGFHVRLQWGSWLTTFPPLRVVIARKPDVAS